ncbi:threonine dehydratase [Nordella sp. HKS 07]|uniref:threonine dehydratase n=1 Tax=Nordella sp. HKS 07 TaxID=2712222 RepID=UPI0013E12D4E|nr:threonine dehydratase [Nordella sp. HKS 07]QIG50678.1 threonine dehydratase [Nordella sp. HKS 07]
MLTHADLERAQSIVYAAMPPTPQYAWPLLAAATQCECWVKHENHTPVGAFKVRGGLVHMRLRRERGETNGVITATRGNHGQSIPFAAGREGIASTVVVPKGNSLEKNEAMRALGCSLIEAGSDFDEARETAMRLAREQGLDMVASFHPELVMGVATYAHELFNGAGALDAVYVPIGLGSGICAVIAIRDLLGLRTKVIGVVAERANAYKLSVAERRAVPTNSALSFADGMAVRVPNADAVAIIAKGADRIVEVSEDEIADAMRLYYRATHNVAEGAGAAALAALVKEQAQMKGQRVGLILSGGNIDSSKFAQVLQGRTPLP